MNLPGLKKIVVAGVSFVLLLTFICYYVGISHKTLKRYIHSNYSLILRRTSAEQWEDDTSLTDTNDFSFTNNNIISDYPVDSACNETIEREGISRRKFVMALSFWEQLTMATNNLCTLVAFSRKWGARTVKPFTRAAEFWGLPSTSKYPVFHGMPPIYNGGPTQPLDILFNMTSFNSEMLCQKYDMPPLASFEEFLANANRKVILLHFSFTAYGKEVPPKEAFKNHDHINCLNSKPFRDFSRRLTSSLKIETNRRGLPHFSVAKACCVNYRHITTPLEMATQCGFFDQDSFTVIITIWRGYSDLVTKKFRLVVPKSPPLYHPVSNKDVFPLNDNLLSNVSAYHRSFSGGKDFIAVHIRTAKLGMLDYVTKKKYSRKCFQLTWKFISSLQKKYKETPIIYFVDYGTYGSHSSEIRFGKRVSRKDFLLKKITPIHYDPDKYGGLKDQGFVALVEQSAMAKAKVLVLVGGGSFQDQILTRFKHSKHGDSAHSICRTQDSLVVKKVYP